MPTSAMRSRLCALMALTLGACRHAPAPPPVPPAPPQPPTAQSALPPDSIDEPLPACRRTTNVGDDASLAAAIAAATPGDCILLGDGDYRIEPITKQATADAPLVLRAAHRGKATVSRAGLTVRASAHVIIEGIDYTAGSSLRLADCDHCRLSRSRIHPPEIDGLEWIVVDGKSDFVRIDHNDLGPFHVKGNFIQLLGDAGQIVRHTRIDHNLFHDREYGGGNGWETIRAGLSGYGLSSAHTVIEKNLFRACAGDPETISVKSSDNVLRYNTFRASAGQLVLRHGNRDVVYGNWLIGLGLPKTGGIRVLGQDHRIFDNYVGDVAGPALTLEGGVSDAAENGRLQYRVHRAQVVNNTLVSSGGVHIGGTHPMAPVDCVFANNLVEGSKGPLVTDLGENTRIAGNVFHPHDGAAVGDFPAASANRVSGPLVAKDGEVYRRTSAGPAAEVALASFAYVTEDIAGRPRLAPDVGAEAWSQAPTRRGPLTDADVGPDAP